MRLQRVRALAVALVGHFGALALFGLYGDVAHALTISPVLVELSPARRVASITISNPGERALSFQTQTLAWTQQDGIDRYDETDELVVVPPIAEIAAGGSQIFRVTLRRPSSAQEQAYRLIFEDVTEGSPASSDEVSVNLRINHNLPVFAAVATKPHAQPRLGPCVDTAPGANGCVRLDNDSNHYLQIKSLVVEGADWRKELDIRSRVLAGAWRQWTFNVKDHLTGILHVRAETSDGTVTTEMPISAH